MAKIRNTPDETTQGTETPANTDAEKIFDKKAPPEPDRYITEVLKTYTMYETLYVDKHGGAYVPDTAPEIRKNAVCYTNPFYKP